MGVDDIMRRNLGPGSGRFQPHVSRPAKVDRTRKPLPTGKKLNVAEEMPKGREMVVAASAPAREMKVVAWKEKPEAMPAEDVRRDRLAARAMGIAACVCVGVWWLLVVLDTVATHWLDQPVSLWGRLVSPAFLVALFGSHALAVTAGAAFRTRDPLGIRAVACFWASVLLWLPVGTLIAMVRDLFA